MNEKYCVKNNFEKDKKVKSILMVGNDEDTNIMFSFHIPTMNRFETLIETVESILSLKNLDDINYEIIITDNSADFSNQNQTYQYFKKKSHPKIKYYINEKNIGLFGNWNRGVILSKGKYYAMIHDDDLLHPQYLVEMLKCIENANKKGKMGFIQVKKINFTQSNNLPKLTIKGKGKIIEYKLTDSLLLGVGPTTAPTCGSVFNREALIESGGYDDDLYPSSDHIVGFIIKENGWNCYTTCDYLGYYRIALNVSLKLDTIKGVVRMDHYITNNCFYKTNYLFSIFGFFFKNIQYSKKIDSWVKIAKNDFKKEVSVKDLDFRLKYRKRYVGNMILIIIQKTNYFRRFIKCKF